MLLCSQCARIGSNIYKVEAHDDDRDLQTNAKIIYRLDNSTILDDWKAFQINKETGNLTLNMNLDMEKKSEYKVNFEMLK